MELTLKSKFDLNETVYFIYRDIIIQGNIEQIAYKPSGYASRKKNTEDDIDFQQIEDPKTYGFFAYTVTFMYNTTSMSVRGLEELLIYKNLEEIISRLNRISNYVRSY